MKSDFICATSAPRNVLKTTNENIGDSDPSYWRARAEEAYTLADQMSHDPKSKEMMIAISLSVMASTSRGSYRASRFAAESTSNCIFGISLEISHLRAPIRSLDRRILSGLNTR